MAQVITGAFPKNKKKTSGKEKPVASYIFHISITFSDPLIWRRVQVPGQNSLHHLHRIIQAAMGWSNSAAHQFIVGKISYEPTMDSVGPRESKRFDERNYKLHTLEDDMQFMFSYLYDAGEGWEHQVQLEEAVPPTRELNKPILLGGERNCPPETVGDVHEYQRLLLASENGKPEELLEHAEDPGFDPQQFNLELGKKRLSQLF